MILRYEHFRSAKVCSRARAWFRKSGLDWHDFLENGIEAEDALAVGTMHPQIHRLMKVAEVSDAEG